MLFPSPLRHLNLSNLPYKVPLRSVAGHDEPHLILYMPLHFRLSHSLTCHDDPFRSPMISFLCMFDFDFLFFMLCEPDVCVINLHMTMPPPSLE